MQILDTFLVNEPTPENTRFHAVLSPCAELPRAPAVVCHTAVSHPLAASYKPQQEVTSFASEFVFVIHTLFLGKSSSKASRFDFDRLDTYILADFKQILFMPTLDALLILQQSGSAAIAPFPLDAFYFHSKFGSIAPTVTLGRYPSSLLSRRHLKPAMPTNQPTIFYTCCAFTNEVPDQNSEHLPES